jgi:PPOX class probable F420-dependent enzyme
MSDLTDPNVQALLSAPNFAVLSTQNGDGTILSTVVWISFVDGVLSVNSSVGRRWPANLEKDPNITLVVTAPGNGYSFLEIRGTTTGTEDGAIDQIHALAHKYLGSDYPWLQPGERRVTFTIEPTRVRYEAPRG